MIVLAATVAFVRAPSRGAQAGEAFSCAASAEATRYDQTQGTACHNCFERQYAPSLEHALSKVNAIEIDFWDECDLLIRGGAPNAWFVRHLPFGGNDNNVGGKGDLAAALQEVKRWSDAHPDHRVLTVYLDKKQDWAASRGPAELDALIKSIFPRNRVFTPSMLLGAHTSLREAAAQGAWPSNEALRGKILFVLTGGALFANVFGEPNRTLHQYASERGKNAVMFVAPATEGAHEISGVPSGFTSRTAQWVVFHNLEDEDVELAPLVRRRGRIARLWDLDETPVAYREAIEKCVNFVAVYDYDNPMLRANPAEAIDYAGGAAR